VKNKLLAAIDISTNSIRCIIRLKGAEDLSVEIYGGQAKGDQFEAAFDCAVELTEKQAAALPLKR
jgi:exopolyphosphatase / guanosine-5'-triphosphate,3'-diphosphate pyrophosphatase